MSRKNAPSQRISSNRRCVSARARLPITASSSTSSGPVASRTSVGRRVDQGDDHQDEQRDGDRQPTGRQVGRDEVGHGVEPADHHAHQLAPTFPSDGDRARREEAVGEVGPQVFGQAPGRGLAKPRRGEPERQARQHDHAP